MTTGAVPLAPSYGGVAASHHLSDAPLVPVRLTAPAHSPPHLFPSSPHHTPTSPAHRAPASSANRTLASPARLTTRAQTMQPNDQAATQSQFFIVLVGYSPGVYTSL